MSATLAAKAAEYCDHASSRGPEYHSTVFQMFNLAREIRRAEREGASRAEVLSELVEVRRMAARSPFFQRIQEWPRGYQGDFETIEYLVAAQNRAEPSTAAHHLEQFGLRSPAAQQHRNKIGQQCRLMTECLRREGSRVLSLACGSSPELLQLAAPAEVHGELVLADFDEDALRCSKARIPAGVAVSLRKVNVLRIEKDMHDEGSFDLILIGGLFDYLQDRTIRRLLRHLHDQLLNPGGRIFFTNVAPAFPDRVFIEYLGDWEMTYRDEEHLEDLVRDSIGESCRLDTYRETLGIATREGLVSRTCLLLP